MEIKIGIKRLIKICALIGLYFINNVCSICNWTSEFQSTQWHDSSRGIVTFQVTSMDGWEFSPTSGTVVTSWNCVSVNTYATDGRIILISANSFQLFGTTYYAYLCIQVTKVTDYSYRYYIDREMHGNLNNERIFIYPVQTLTDADTICSSSGATGGEYQSWVQVGNEQNAKLNCPWSILGQYRYTHTFSNGQSSCDVTTSELDLCTDTHEMSFAYSACSTKVAYSVSNSVWCVDNIPVGNTNYVMLFNGNDADTDIDDVTVYRFTCMAISDSMNTASVSPKYCQSGQLADDYPVSTSGQQSGALLSFSAPTTTCPTCPELSAPTYGIVDVSTVGSVTSALYTCDTNYTLWGTSTRTCQDTDTWTDSAPACNCASPAVPENGTVTVNADGSVAVYTCSKGFTLNGISVRNCQSAKATWEDADPTCTPCNNFVTIPGQASTLSTTGTVTSANFICGAGFTLSGSQSLICASNGTWNASQPNCVTCGFLTTPASGTLVLLSDGAVSTANYACAPVYTLQGDSIRTCQLNSTWDGSAPECTCNKPNTPSNGAVDANGEVATYTCNVGYSLNGYSTRTCQTNGTGWSGANPACSQCNTLASVTGGDYTLSTTGTLTSAKYTCQVGYSLDGTSTITCLNDGSWGSASATCVECQPLSDPTSGTVSLSSSGTKTSATYACASEYNLNGNTIRLCNSDGTWSLVEPTCTCKSPTAPQNGNVTENGVTASYICDQGYSLSGLSTRVCATDGTGWSGSDPTCSTCVTPSSPTGGTVNIYTDGYNTQASFTCSSGYTLNGVSPITCRNDGSWDFTAPTCAQCPDVDAPDSGSMTTTSDGVSTTVTFLCQSGYYLNGAFTITCGTDGSWSNSVPTCKCNFPDTPSDGGVSVSDTSEGPTASYSCFIGYSLNGPSERICMSDGTGWEGVEPECTVCQTVSNPVSGTFSLDSNETHTAVTFSCDVGSTLDGDIEQVCLSDGSWDSVPPICVTCSTLSDPSSGLVTYSRSGSSTIATFACVTGYTLSSSSTLTCSSSGLWDLTSPYCICKSPSLISNGELTITDNLSTARYECYTGYVLVGSDTRYCQDDGTGWSGISPACSSEANIGASTEGDDKSWNVHIAVVVVAIVLLLCLIIALAAFIHMYLRLRQNNSRVSSAVSRTSKEPDDPEVACRTLNNPVGGSFTLSTNGTTSFANYSCIAGYTMAGDPEQTCQTDQTWSPSAPICVQCDALGELSSGSISISTNGFISTATYTCISGYILVGGASRSCQINGLWDGSKPLCECGSPSTPSNGVVLSDGVTANYSCTVNHTLYGPQYRTCGDDGTGWTDSDPLCTSCQALSAPVGGTVVVATTGTQTYALFYCEQGYTISGGYKVYCQSDGFWDTLPTCADCTPLTAPDSGAVSTYTTGRVTMATFTCSSGYDLNGDGTNTCLTDGSWQLEPPICTCQSPASIQHGEVSDDGVTAVYTCHVRYSLDGASDRSCATDGSGWPGSDPICNPCDTLDTPTGGNVTLTTDGINTVATHICHVGYILTGTDIIKCRNDGTWDFSQPECVSCPTLDAPSSGSVVMDTDSKTSTATFSCITGYYISGSLVLTCLTNGQWDNEPPTCKCITPSAPSSGTVYVSDTSQGPVATYQCELGYSMNGLTSRLCLSNGTGWQGDDPVCSECSNVAVTDGLEVSTVTNGIITTAEYTCSVNYTLSGTQDRTCLSDGTWNNSPPTCVECATLNHPASGVVTLSTSGTMTEATYSCSSGYYVSGAITLTCQTSGQWDDLPPLCRCLTPAGPQYGSVSVSDTSQGTVANYLCTTGHSINGMVSRQCLDDGTGWEGSDPSCNQCDTLDTPTGGNVTLTTDGINTVATHICHVGYILTGTDIITCRNDGTWDFSQPECVSCPTLDAPSSGSVVMDTDSKTSTATFSCITGYYISGSLVLTCLTNGQWDNEPPSCKCITPSAPSSGTVYVSDTSQGPVATYQCELGYSINGLTSRLCLSNGTGWQGDDPVCSECSNVAVTDGLEVSTVTNGIITTAEYTCNVNYTLSGTQDRTCLSDGTWNNSPPTCVECATLNHPASGVVTLSTSGTMTEAAYSCSSGYYVSGAITLTCQTSGQWDDLPPLCRCLTPAGPQYGSVSVSDTSQGPVANYLCTTGHSINGMVSRQCLDDGTGWEGSDPSCNTCNQITTTQELQYVISSNGTSSFATYACALNYSLSGEHEHTCNADGSWNFAQPTCVICPEKHNPLSGQVTMATDGLNTIATFSCVKGYSLNSTAESTCLTDGTWDNLDPYCICDPPKEVSNGEYILLDDGMLVNFTCDDGYELVGPRIMECLTNGTGWNDTQPICVTTSAPVGASTDNTVLSIPIGAFVAMVIVVIFLVILLIILALCYHNRMRKDRQRISATFDTSSDGKSISESTRFTFESPDVENGKAKLLKNVENNNSKFNARKLKKKSSQGSLKSESRNGITEGIRQDMSNPAPVETIPNGLSPKSVPLASVRLPKLPPRPRHSQGGTPHKTKRKRRRVERREIQENPTPESNTTSSTPVEIIMNRLNTPDILQSAKFDYIQPQFCHEVQTPSPSRPTTSVTRGRHVPVFSDDDPTSESNV